MKWTREKVAVTGKGNGDVVAAQLVAAKRRRFWRLVIGAHVVALVSAIVGCFMMMKTQDLKTEIAEMRDEIGETLTVMSLEGGDAALARHLPKLVDQAARWEHEFSKKRENFRGMDAEINHVQALHRLGVEAKGWRRELEGVSSSRRGECWRTSLKARVEAEQKKWPNRRPDTDKSGWVRNVGKEFWFGVKHGLLWPLGIYERTSELVRGGRGISSLGIGDRLRYVLFPYRLSGFTLLRLGGIMVITSAVGYLLCWLGLRSKFSGLSYVGLLYFLYLFNIALFILYLETTK